MATISILSNVDIRDKKLARKFIEALEDAKSEKEASDATSKKISRKVKEITKDQIKSLFGKC
jgi:hypothetical protein